jgi:hypothetical protein
MISRIVPMASPFLKYVRRSEVLWMLLHHPLAAPRREKDGIPQGTCKLQLVMSLSLERTQDAPFMFAIGGTGKARC